MHAPNQPRIVQKFKNIRDKATIADADNEEMWYEAEAARMYAKEIQDLLRSAALDEGDAEVQEDIGFAWVEWVVP